MALLLYVMITNEITFPSQANPQKQYWLVPIFNRVYVMYLSGDEYSEDTLYYNQYGLCS